MKTRHWIFGIALFGAILAAHLAIGANHAVHPARVSGWIDQVGNSFDLAVVKATASTPAGRGPASVASDVKSAP